MRPDFFGVRFFLILALLSTAAIAGVAHPVQQRPAPEAYRVPPWPVNCENDIAWDGYHLDWANFCVPGILSQDTLEMAFPRQYYGALSSYAPGIMEELEANHHVRVGHGVALMSCQYIGYTVWLRIPGRDWQGPFTVVDCSNPAHTFYHIAIAGLAAEIGATAAQEWGIRAARRVDVSIGRRPAAWEGVNLSSWWVRRMQWENGWNLIGEEIAQ